MYKLIVRPFLFLFDPEKIHYVAFSLIRFLCKVPLGALIFRKIYQIEDKRLERKLFGITFKNPVGLAAGFDKNAVLFNELANFGFGFIEIGTVTPIGQEGNPKKRLFRLKDDAGIINRMGFNNDGLEIVIEQLKKNKGKLIIGGNIGKKIGRAHV
jgi:dihydroorotate dehydrogenase